MIKYVIVLNYFRLGDTKTYEQCMYSSTDPTNIASWLKLTEKVQSRYSHVDMPKTYNKQDFENDPTLRASLEEKREDFYEINEITDAS